MAVALYTWSIHSYMIFMYNSLPTTATTVILNEGYHHSINFTTIVCVIATLFLIHVLLQMLRHTYSQEKGLSYCGSGLSSHSIEV